MSKIELYTAPWCGACIQLKNTFKQVECKNVPVELVDVEEFPERALKYDIMSLPTLIFLKDGVPITKLVGTHPVNVIQTQVNLLV